MSARTTAAKPKAKSAAPVQLKKRSAQPAREALFAVDDIEYTMPVVVELGTALALENALRFEPNENAKGMMLVRELCGPDALAALLGDATMTRADWRRIVEILTERAFGPIEQREGDGEGN